MLFSLPLYAYKDDGMTKHNIYKSIIHGVFFFLMNNMNIVFYLFLNFLEGDLTFTQDCFVQSLVEFDEFVLPSGS